MYLSKKIDKTHSKQSLKIDWIDNIFFQSSIDFLLSVTAEIRLSKARIVTFSIKPHSGEHTEPDSSYHSTPMCYCV